MPQTQLDTSAASELLRELILYICEESEGDDSFGSVKLNKLLFYSDFDSYLDTGAAITSNLYVKQEFGPVPQGMLALLDDMQAKGEIAIREEPTPGGHVRKRPLGLRKPNLQKFTAEQIVSVSREIRRFRGITGTDISVISHQFIGWKVANINDVIPYSLALLENRELTEEELRFGRELIPQASQLAGQYAG